MFIVIRIFLGRIFVPLLVVGGFVFACSGSAWADDVYNFYFQKWPAPTAPIDASKTLVPTPTKVDDVKKDDVKTPEQSKPGDGALNSTTTSLATAASPPAPEEFRRWSIGLGLSRVEDQSTFNGNLETQGYAFDLEYDFSRYFGLNGELYVSNDTVNALWGGPAQISPLHQFDGSLGMVVTPFHIQLFGSNFLSLGFQLGGICQFAGSGINWDGALYYGALASVNLTDRISFVVDAKRYNDIAYDYAFGYGIGDPTDINTHLTPGNMNAYEYGILLKLKL